MTGRPIAAIDIGSNSIHLTLARVSPAQAIEVLGRHKDAARLAAHLDDRRVLAREAIDRAIRTLRRFRELADAHGAAVRATATATLRAARNGHDFVRRARDEAGIPVELLSGADEARLTYRGVLHGAPHLNGRRLLCIDVGGGSTELLVGDAGRALVIASVPWGSLRVTERLLGPDPYTTAAIRRARHRLADDFAPALATVRTARFEVAIATSGSAQRLGRMVQAARGRSPAGLDGEVLDRGALAEALDRLLRARTRAERLRLPGMDPERADSLAGGALIFETLTRGLSLEAFTLSTAALRTGLVIDTWLRAG